MLPATAHTLVAISILQNEFEPGRVERRIIAYYFEGLKYELYNLVSLRLGRDSREAETCKDKLRKALATVKKICYEMVNEDLDGKVRLDGHAIAGIVHYATRPNDIITGPLWHNLEPLFNFTFKGKQGVIKFLQDEVTNYIQKRTPMLESQFAVQWEGAVRYIRNYECGI